MDIVTQGLLGGVLAQSVASDAEKNRATFVGVISGLLADADILIQSSGDPLLTIDFHRHFTHSLIFIPVGAMIAYMLLWPFMRKHFSNVRLYVFCLAGFSMSGLLDACTSYGTHLLWPFSDERVAWHIISIVDPIFTLILLITFACGLRYKYKKIAYVGLNCLILYLAVGYVQLQRTESYANELAESRNHITSKHIVKPTLGNLMLWRSVYVYDGIIYVDAIRTGILSEPETFVGESVKQFSLNRDFPELDPGTTLYRDIQRFIRFSDGFVAIDSTQTSVLGDLRYSMLPVSANPLWGIVIDSSNPEKHVDYRFFRNNSHEMRMAFLAMLLGNTKNGSVKDSNNYRLKISPIPLTYNLLNV